MRLGLFLTTLIGLAGASHISSAADASWLAAGAVRSTSRYDAASNTIRPIRWQTLVAEVDILGNTRQL